MRATITMVDNGYMVDASSAQLSIDNIHVYKPTLVEAIAEATRFLKQEDLPVQMTIERATVITEEGSQDI